MSETLLVVTGDRELARVVAAAVELQEVTVRIARDLDAATRDLGERDVLFVLVDVSLAGGLALVSLARSLSARSFVAVAVDPAEAASVRAALDLGADVLLTVPLTGDALLRALTQARELVTLRDEARESLLEAERWKRSASELRRVVDAAVSGEDELVSATLDALTELAPSVRAKVELRGPNEPITAVSADTPRLVLGEEGQELGTIELSGGDPAERGVALEIAGVLSSLLALRARVVDAHARHGGSRVLDKRQFDDAVTREIDKARRHRRTFSILSLDLATVDLTLLAAHLRASDVIGRTEREVLVLLPETGTIGAARLRRRVTRGLAGTATMPRDGTTRDALVRAARARREELARSSLAESPVAESLSAFVAEVLPRPPLDAGPLALYPLVLSLPALVSMVSTMCFDAARVGEAFVDVAGGDALVSAVRDAEREREGALAVLEHRAPSDLFAVVLTSELGCWACVGRATGDSISAIHGADPLLGDRVVGALEAS